MNSVWNTKAYRLRAILLILTDVVVIQIASFLAIYIRYDFHFGGIPIKYFEVLVKVTPVHTAFILIVFAICKLYSSVWRYASVDELFNIMIACGIVVVCDFLSGRLFKIDIPRSFYPLFILFLMMGSFTCRFSYRFFRLMREKMSTEGSCNVMIIGAGAAGLMIAKEIRNSTYLNYNLKCAIDDNPNKHGKYVMGVKIVGGRECIEEYAQKYQIDEIIIAMPSVGVEDKKQILEICSRTSCKLRILPGLYQLVNGDIEVSKLREVQIEDLLGRDAIHIDNRKISKYVEGKVVMITGGGGSIGSELCRQIALNNPSRLIILDIYENNAYDIQQELKRRFANLNLTVIIASVRNTNRIETIFKKYRPDIVFHAAAHKHVPLMEESPNEAIKNNVFGTYKTAMAAGKYGVKKFVLISTDKAVNPTNIMGASKRICEMVIQMMNKEFPNSEFVAVRFGNVLGSNGSVIPLFKKQIENGGPVTVTDPNIIRYFMTIPEAVSLVLEAGAYAKGGEIFILDMGEPVKIVDLAQNLIRLSGYRNGEIKIEFTGLRPGEKLYEELLMAEEGMKDTDNKLIHIGKSIEFDEDEFREKLAKLDRASRADSDSIREIVKEVVPTYEIRRN